MTLVYVAAYLGFGLVLAELALKSTLRLKQRFTNGAYLITILLWPLTLTIAVINILKGKQNAGTKL